MALYQNDPFVRGKMLLVIGRPPCMSSNCLPMANHSGHIVRVSWQCKIRRVSMINKVVYESQPNQNWVIILHENDAWPTLTKQTLHQMRVNLKGNFLLWVFLHLNICVMTMGAVKFMSFLVFLMGPTSLTTELPHTHLHWHKAYIKWRWK